MSLRLKVAAAIVRKDLLSLWPMVAVAIVLLLADIVVANFADLGGNELRALLPLVAQLTCALLVVAVIQQDTAVSVSHDWLTKPLSRVDVVAAKGLFIALAVFAPIVLIRSVVYVIQGFSLGEALLTALDVDDIFVLLALPVVIAAAAVTPTLLQAAATLIGLFVLIFVVPTALVAMGVPTLDEGIIFAGSGWVLLWIATIAALGVAAAALYLQYGRRSTASARAVLVVVPALLVIATSFVRWPEIFAVQKAVAAAPPADDFAIRLNAGCFPAESTTLLAGGGHAPPQMQLIGAGLWNRDDLQAAGSGAVAFATGVAARELEDDWLMRVAQVVATYRDEHGDVLERALPARIPPVRQMSLEGDDASTNFWLLPSAALERLQREPSAQLSLTYSLALLEPSTVDLAADGARRHIPGIGYCGATYDPADSTIAIDCVKRGAQPALITAQIPGAPLRIASTPYPDYEPAWLEALEGRRYPLTLQVPPGVDHSKVELTAYEARSHFDRTIERAGILGGAVADCPLPPASPQSSLEERTVWRDASPHTVLFVNVADGVRLEVLDWGGTGRPLVLLHGLGATAHAFDDFAPKLAGRYRVIGITRRGIGASTIAESGYDLPTLAQDILRVLDALEIDSSAVAIGHSIAGEELHELGARHSDRFAGLVYLDAAADRTFKQPPEFEAAMEARPDPPPARPDELASYAALRDYSVRLGGVAIPEGEILATYSFTPAGSVGGRSIDGRVMKAIADGVLKPDYAAFRVPALALYAIPRSPDDLMRPWYDRSDPVLRAKVEREYELTVSAFDFMKRTFEQEIPNARAVNLLGAKHWIFISNEAEVLAEIERFVAELPPR